MAEVTPSEVSVVIPTRDRPAHLRTALWSLARQDGGVAAVVVVDDGSAVPATAAAVGERRPLDVRLVRNARSLGVAGARNRGLEEVETAWVAFLDDDDVFLPGHLARVTAALTAAGGHRAGVGLGYAAVLVTDAARRPRNVIPAHPPADVALALHGGNVLPTPSCVVVRTDLVRGEGGFDPALTVSADWDLWLRVARRAPRAAASPVPSVLYTQHAGNMHHGAQTTLDELAEMQRRHGAAGARLGVAMPDPGFPAYLGGTLKTAGRHREAAAWYLRSFRARRHGADLLRAVAALLRVGPPAGWRRPRLDGDIEDWLDGLRAFEAERRA
jgi:hypothetical protein